MKTTFKRLPRVFTGVVLLIAGFILGTNTLQAQTFSVLHSFATPPKGPSGLVQGSDGNLYGTTAGGGDADRGTVFRISSSGNLTILHSFHDTDGAAPGAGLVQASDGFFYGTTSGGGTAGFGTVFKVEASGTLTTIHSFGGADGKEPAADLVQASDGNFYGTTHGGGAGGWGTVFKISPSGDLTTLHSFDQADGAGSRGKLIQATDGALYGTTPLGGMTSTACNTGCGTVFRITTSGNLTTLHFFNHADGASPEGGLIQGRDGNLYGTTEVGGAAEFGTIFRIDTAGTTLTTLDSFRGGTDGANPWAALLQASDGSFYGTTRGRREKSAGCGTVFKVRSLRNPDDAPLFQSNGWGRAGRQPHPGERRQLLRNDIQRRPRGLWIHLQDRYGWQPDDALLLSCQRTGRRPRHPHPGRRRISLRNDRSKRLEYRRRRHRLPDRHARQRDATPHLHGRRRGESLLASHPERRPKLLRHDVQRRNRRPWHCLQDGRGRKHHHAPFVHRRRWEQPGCRSRTGKRRLFLWRGV